MQSSISKQSDSVNAEDQVVKEVVFFSFHDLKNSSDFEDLICHDLFIRLLDAIFGKHDDITVKGECESEKNIELIKDQWRHIECSYKLKNRVKSTKKCVRQTIKNIIDYLNITYQFKQPIQFIPKKQSFRSGSLSTSYSYTCLTLV